MGRRKGSVNRPKGEKLDTKAKKPKADKAAKARANGAAAEPVVRQPVDRGVSYTIDLPVPVDEHEVAEAAAEMVREIRKREAVLEERREDMARHKEDLVGIDKRMQDLASTVENHTRKKPVKVTERVVTETATIEIVRTDTGEVVSTRPAEATDVQQGLFAKDVAEGACAQCGKKDGHGLDCATLLAETEAEVRGEVADEADGSPEHEIVADQALLDAADSAAEAEEAEA